MKILPINNNISNPTLEDIKLSTINRTEIKTISIFNEFSEMLHEIIERFYLNKLPPEMITKDILKNISNDAKFLELKNKIFLLQVFIYLFIIFNIHIIFSIEIKYC